MKPKKGGLCSKLSCIVRYLSKEFDGIDIGEEDEW